MGTTRRTRTGTRRDSGMAASVAEGEAAPARRQRKTMKSPWGWIDEWPWLVTPDLTMQRDRKSRQQARRVSNGRAASGSGGRSGGPQRHRRVDLRLTASGRVYLHLAVRSCTLSLIRRAQLILSPPFLSTLHLSSVSVQSH